MTSFHFDLDHPKDEAAAAFVAEVGLRLQQALLERKSIEGITQQEIARRLGVGRSRVNRCFSGYANLSLESLAELCWAMDIQPAIDFHQIVGERSSNYQCDVRQSAAVAVEPTTTPSKRVDARTSVAQPAASTGSTAANRSELVYGR